jgi:5'-3' exonuclease
MNRLRALQSSDDPIVIYGLDADLVLLTLLNSKSPAYLMREDQDSKDERYAYLSTDVLKKALWPLSLPDQLNDTIRDYVAAMTLLGNDFLPHSLTVKIKEDGHSFLLSELSEMKKSNLTLLELDAKGQYKFRKEALLFLFERWALKESDMLLHSLKRKLQMRGRPGPENVLENRPLEWAVERSIVQVSTNQWSLMSVWKEHYTREWLLCDDADRPSKLYLEGLQWTLDYYTGQKGINTRWYFPFYVPPLWSQLASYTAKCDTLPLSDPPDIRLTPIEPQEQLAMVLPLESWHLLEKAPLHLRTLPSRKPYYWPSRFDFFSAGRLWMWECEPLVPILRVEELRGKNL